MRFVKWLTKKGPTSGPRQPHQSARTLAYQRVTHSHKCRLTRIPARTHACTHPAFRKSMGAHLKLALTVRTQSENADTRIHLGSHTHSRAHTTCDGHPHIDAAPHPPPARAARTHPHTPKQTVEPGHTCWRQEWRLTSVRGMPSTSTSPAVGSPADTPPPLVASACPNPGLSFGPKKQIFVFTQKGRCTPVKATFPLGTAGGTQTRI